MATQLTTENAQAAVGRFVRIREKSGNKSGGGGRLIGVDGDEGLVRVNNHANVVTRFKLEHLAWDTTANGGHLIVHQPPPPVLKPVRVPEPTMTQARQQRAEAAREELASAIAEAELTDFSDFAGKVRKAAADVTAAKRMASELATLHKRELDELKERQSVAEIESADVLKAAEHALQELKSKAATLMGLFEPTKD